MRFSALIPVVFITASFILTFLCLFAGSRKGLLEDYAVLTLNTSRIGYDVFDNSDSSSSDNAVTSIIDNIGDSIQDEIEEGINDVAQDLGIHDFYSAHLMNYCEGFYVPGATPNSTVSKSQIHKNVTECSNRTAMYNFDPQQIIQKELNNSVGDGVVNLVNDLDWPEDITNGIRALQVAAKATFVLYCIAIGFIGIALILAVVSIFSDGRLSALLNVMVDWLAFLVIGIASAIATAIAVKGASVINRYGDDIGVSAQQGNKFMILTWIATGLMLLASIVWCFDCIVGGRRRVSRPKYN
ncbi:hypothetical protein M409DRAFT_50195 [Zasmidium cellare ATCC 36951]|uniref:MARVEL domain-containing protein n=1 Tax=Zasmidium cellare ATCC 36951 TaxID=1080233 RepID=A0A6A6CZ62_ZASCE|nr:uncharacterized protein M409DRAFT_50195 [Zasmidium cellare ATCC 36951]KAF2172507.1 hypothetical protein M409DRAFT_50195 [Zasmidium cellare ATCC 36951]